MRPCRARSKVPSITSRLDPGNRRMDSSCSHSLALGAGMRSGRLFLHDGCGRLGDPQAEPTRECVDIGACGAVRGVDDDLGAGTGVGQGIVVENLANPAAAAAIGSR